MICIVVEHARIGQACERSREVGEKHGLLFTSLVSIRTCTVAPVLASHSDRQQWARQRGVMPAAKQRRILGYDASVNWAMRIGEKAFAAF
jgi:hypothetical protein